MPRKHSLIVRGTKDTPEQAPEQRPYYWRAGGRTRADALRRAGLGTARIPPAPERRCRDE